MAPTPAKRACPVCGALLADDSPFCPVCAFQQALGTQTYSDSNSSSELRFEHYTVLQNAEGKPFELGHGGMGVTYKAFDVHLQCPVALKIVNAQLFENESARLRFVREARAAASVRHQNVASVFHIGESGGNYYYAMEFVEGETLAALIQRLGRLETDLALEIVGQIAAGLAAIEKQHLVHRDIKPSNMMVSFQGGKLESVKIIDLGLAKGVAEENTLSTVGAFIGTPAYASPEQFAGIATDIRSDLYSLGITLWEMLSGKLPFAGSAAELMYQHQHAEPPIQKLTSVSKPVIALLQVLLAKDPNQRFQSPAQLQNALPKVGEAIGCGLGLTADELRSASAQVAESVRKGRPTKQAIRWVLGAGLCFAALLLAWFFFSGHAGFLSNRQVTEISPSEKSIAVLPFESLSENKNDSYFAEGVQGEILNNLAKIARLKVISRTSVMQYRADAKRNLRQIAADLGVANVLEGTVRRDANYVRVSTELVDARNDNTIWADSYDRDLTDIFAIQSEIAQTIARKLTATLSPEEKKRIEQRPTQNLEAYALYLRGKELVQDLQVEGDVAGSMRVAVALLEQAVHLDPNFTLAYCVATEAHDALYHFVDPTPERRALADAAVKNALRIQPDLPEVRLAYAHYLYLIFRDYKQARVQLAIARAGLPNSAEAIILAAWMDRRQGNFEKAIEEFNQAIELDPRNTNAITDLSITLFFTRQYRAANRVGQRLVEFFPDQPIIKLAAEFNVLKQNGDETGARLALAAVPKSMTDDTNVLFYRLYLALADRDWPEAKGLIDKMKEREDEAPFSYIDGLPAPVECFSILLSRLQGEQFNANPTFIETRQRLNEKVLKLPGNAKALSQLAVVDALLNNKETAISEGKAAVEMAPIFKDAVDGPDILANLAVVYAWAGELDLAFATLEPLKKTPSFIGYGDFKCDSLWTPLRKDPRFDKLLAELAPHA